MKKFFVLKHYNGSILPDVTGQFDSEDDAKAFAKLSNMTDPSHMYSVAKLQTVFDENKQA